VKNVFLKISRNLISLFCEKNRKTAKFSSRESSDNKVIIIISTRVEYVAQMGQC